MHGVRIIYESSAHMQTFSTRLHLSRLSVQKNCSNSVHRGCICTDSADLMHTFYYYTPQWETFKCAKHLHMVCADALHLHIVCSCILIAHYLVIIVGYDECLHMQTLHTFNTLLFFYRIKILLQCAFSLHFFRKSKYESGLSVQAQSLHKVFAKSA